MPYSEDGDQSDKVNLGNTDDNNAQPNNHTPKQIEGEPYVELILSGTFDNKNVTFNKSDNIMINTSDTKFKSLEINVDEADADGINSVESKSKEV